MAYARCSIYVVMRKTILASLLPRLNVSKLTVLYLNSHPVTMNTNFTFILDSTLLSNAPPKLLILLQL